MHHRRDFVLIRKVDIRTILDENLSKVEIPFQDSQYERGDPCVGRHLGVLRLGNWDASAKQRHIPRRIVAENIEVGTGLAQQSTGRPEDTDKGLISVTVIFCTDGDRQAKAKHHASGDMKGKMTMPKSAFKQKRNYRPETLNLEWHIVEFGTQQVKNRNQTTFVELNALSLYLKLNH